MDVVTGAVGSLISKLGQLLTKEYKLQKSAPEKLVSLIKELESAHAALRKVGGVPPDQLEENVRIWAREIRDASYDMEDEIDTFLVEGDGGHGEHSAGQESLIKRLQDYVGGLFGKMNNLFKRRKLAVAVDDINKRLEEVTQRRGRYTVDSITVATPAATSRVDPRLEAMYKEMTQLVGISKSSSDVISMLEKTEMVSVVGVGGLGKTTLAKSVYDKLRVDMDLKFECLAFVPVGRDPDLKKVFRDILIDIDKNKYMDTNTTMLDERQLINEIRGNLGNKRYLLVIDDIWETKSWKIIKLALVQNHSGSRVITTTRILEVAKEAGEVYNLQKLQYEESKKLFYKRIYGGDGTCPDNHQDHEVSERILNKCDGVPLAIITMASLLVHKSREQWIEVCNSIFNRQVNRDVSNTEWILSLSYYDLPAHLKTCVLYLSAFPEDYTIKKDTLIWMWVAEGFVQKKYDGTGFYEVGERYFNDLINRSIIQAFESNYDLECSCRVHDMVLDLLRHISMQENFVTFSNNDNTILPSGRVYRLAHQNRTMEPTHEDRYTDKLGHLRSLVAYSCEYKSLSLPTFKLLRVLSLVQCKGTIDLWHLKSLLHLRYLRLWLLETNELPKGVGALKLLQTLSIVGINYLPSSVGQLTELISLRVGMARMPSGVLEKLTSLEQLTMSVPNDSIRQFVKELGKLHELRVLHACLDGPEAITESEFVESLGNLSKIQRVKLEGWVRDVDTVLETLVFSQTLQILTLECFFFPMLPSWINPSGLPNLSILWLCVKEMDDEGLEILGLLPELHHLRLSIKHCTVLTIHSANDGWFRKLRSLSLLDSMVQFVPKEDLNVPFSVGYGQPDVVLVPETRDFMPKLEVLEFFVDVDLLMDEERTCDNLGLECIPSLQKVNLYFVCSSAFSDDDVKRETKAALRKAIEVHPNRPSLEITDWS